MSCIVSVTVYKSLGKAIVLSIYQVPEGTTVATATVRLNYILLAFRIALKFDGRKQTKSIKNLALIPFQWILYRNISALES